MRGTVAVALGGALPGRPVTLNVCGVYCFDEAGKRCARGETAAGGAGWRAENGRSVNWAFVPPML